MNALNVKSALLLVLVLGLAGGLRILQAGLPSQPPANWEPATTAESTQYTTANNLAVYPGAAGSAYAATVTARSSNAFEARLMLEQQISTIARHVRNQGGGIRPGETSYSRVEKIDGNPGSYRHHDFVIVQRIQIVFSAKINQARTKARLARLAVNGVSINIPD